MFKYFTLVSFIYSLGCYCISADTAVTSNNNKSDNSTSYKSLKKNNKKVNTNIVIIRQEELNILRNFLQKTKKDNESNNDNSEDSNDITNMLESIESTSKLLKDIKKKQNKNNQLILKIKQFNEQIKRIEEFCNNLLKKQSIHTNDTAVNLYKDNIKLTDKNNNVQYIIHLNWNKDTRNNSHVIINPLEVSDDNLLIDNVNKECIVIDISKPLTYEQVEEYYGGLNKENDVPMQGTLVNKNNNYDNINKPISDLQN